MRSPATCAATALLLLVPFCACAAGDYWTYTYRGIEVTAQGNSAFTVNLARYCARLDALLAQVLSIHTTYRVPTRMDAATLRGRAREDYQRLLAADSGNRAAAHALAVLDSGG
jgi:hypothetical protein